MKKAWQFALVGLCAVFLAFTAGLFLGRSHGGSEVVLEIPSSLTAPTTRSIQTPPALETSAPAFPVNINTANCEQLQTIAGIGPVLAQRIVAFRQENGAFSRVEDLLLVEGIGEKRLENMLEFITTGV